MRRTFPLAACAALMLTAAVGLPPVAAGTLQINPILVEIGERHRTGSVTVRNVEDVPVTIRAYPLAWSQERGDDRYDETHAVIVSPPVFTIPPGGTQIVRVGMRRPGGAQTFRLMIEEVPEANQGGGIRVALRLNLPLYSNLAQGAPADLRWTATRQAGGDWAIEAHNDGSGWVRVDAAIAENATGLRFEDGFAFGTVLPGSARRWLVGANPRIGNRARFQLIAGSGSDAVGIPPPSRR
jgi:fimbrial chaperone protein